MKKSVGMLLSMALFLALCVSGKLAVTATETEPETTAGTVAETALSEENLSLEETTPEETLPEEPESSTPVPETEREEEASVSPADVETEAETTAAAGEETSAAADSNPSKPEGSMTLTVDLSHMEAADVSSVPEEEEGTAHRENCWDSCQDEACLCPCHLFDRLMACETPEELYALAENTPEEQLLSLTEEQNAQIEEKLAAWEPEPLPAVTLEESSDEPVPSEIVYPTVNFSNVAPFGAPVEG